MKQLCCLATITFLSAQAYAGIILPDLSRSKSQANSSPIAVGFSDRNSATFTYSHESQSSEQNGADFFDADTGHGNGSVFYSNPKFHMELETGYADNTIDNKAPTSADIDTGIYNIKGSFAVPLFEKMSAGVSISESRVVSTTGKNRSANNVVEITPGFGMKVHPNIAVGAGVIHTINALRNSVVAGAATENPTLSTNNIFAGVAYGVDQKIGADGFGVEAVISHSLKEQEKSSTLTRSSGALTSLTVNGNYIVDIYDLNFSAVAATGKDYSDNITTSAQIVTLRPEIMIANPFYIAPEGSYVHVKNGATTGLDLSGTVKAWTYGLGVGMRKARYDVEVKYLHGSNDITPGTLEADSNNISGRFSFYF